MVSKPDRSAAKEFSDQGVVAAYAHKPDYPPTLYDALLRLMPSRSRALDLGTGPGKIARALAPHVDEVLAVDPSTAMLSLAAALNAGSHLNIRWINSPAEDLPLGDGSIDLAVAGAAIHWMDASVIFPKLARALVPTFMAEVRQSLDDLIECEHSRATWSRTRMGDLAPAFDADLRKALHPWTSDGVLTFSVATTLTYGHPLAA